MKPARHGDPSTSQDAAADASTLRKRLLPFISEALLSYGGRGAVLDEIWAYVRQHILVQGRDSVGPRMIEMERRKLVCRHLIGYTPKGDPIYEQRRSVRTGRAQEIWWDYSFKQDDPQ